MGDSSSVISAQTHPVRQPAIGWPVLSTTSQVKISVRVWQRLYTIATFEIYAYMFLVLIGQYNGTMVRNCGLF